MDFYAGLQEGVMLGSCLSDSRDLLLDIEGVKWKGRVLVLKRIRVGVDRLDKGKDIKIGIIGKFGFDFLKFFVGDLRRILVILRIWGLDKGKFEIIVVVVHNCDRKI